MGSMNIKYEIFTVIAVCLAFVQINMLVFLKPYRELGNCTYKSDSFSDALIQYTFFNGECGNLSAFSTPELFSSDSPEGRAVQMLDATPPKQLSNYDQPSLVIILITANCIWVFFSVCLYAVAVLNKDIEKSSCHFVMIPWTILAISATITDIVAGWVEYSYSVRFSTFPKWMKAVGYTSDQIERVTLAIAVNRLRFDVSKFLVSVSLICARYFLVIVSFPFIIASVIVDTVNICHSNKVKTQHVK